MVVPTLNFVEGESSLGQRSILATSFVNPLGQRRSTRMRTPSSASGFSYTRLIRIGIDHRGKVLARTTQPVRTASSRSLPSKGRLTQAPERAWETWKPAITSSVWTASMAG